MFAKIRDTAQCGDEEEGQGDQAGEDVQHLHSYVNTWEIWKIFSENKKQ